MTVKERIFNAGLSNAAFTAEEFISHARPAIFGALDDGQKHAFIRMERREQGIYVEAVLKEMGIKIPVMQA
jgi:hypothetical protein